MRQLALVLVLLAAIAFVVGTYCAFGHTSVAGCPPVTYWRGAVGFLLFAITILMLGREGKTA